MGGVRVGVWCVGVCVVLFGATAWGGAPVRWVNAAGGDWNEPANWDAGRVPLDGEAVLFDLEGAYTVTVCGARPAMWSVLRVDRSEVVFDLCGSALAVQPQGLFEWAPVIEIGGDTGSGAGVEFANGTVFDPDSWLLDAEMVVDGTVVEGLGGVGGTVVRIAADAVSGPVGRVVVVGGAELAVDGVLEMFFSGQMDVGAGGLVVVEAGGSLVGGKFASIVVDGAVEVIGAATAVESTISGDGVVRVTDGGVLDGWYLFNGVTARPEGASWVSSAYIADATLDWRGATGDTAFSVVGDLGFAVFERVEFVADLCSMGGAGGGSGGGAPLVEFGLAFEVGFWDCRLRLGGSCVPAVGEAAALMRWRWPEDFGEPVPRWTELELVSEVEGERQVLLRVGRVDAETMGVFALGTPEGWCWADIDFSGTADFFDASLFLSLYQAGSAWADVNGDLAVDFFDLSEFFALLNGGCGA